MSMTPVVRQILAGLSAEDVARLPDAELLSRFIASRDEAAFAVMVERHGPMVLGICRRALGQVQDAEDAAQAVFLVLARNARRVRKPEALAAWLHGVAVRVARKAGARRRKVEPLPKVMAAADSPDRATWADALRVIDEALAGLPESLRVPLVLCYLEGLTRDEAATRLGVPLDTFRGRLERGREKLRAALARRGFPLAAGLVSVLLESPARAAPEWVDQTSALANGSLPVPRPIATLTGGILPERLSQYWLAGGVFAALAFGGGVWAAATATPPESPDPRAAAVAAEELVPLLPKDRTGVWRSVVISRNGNLVEDITIRFTAADELVWESRRRSPGVDYRGGIRFRFAVNPAGKLLLTGLASLLADGLETDPAERRELRLEYDILPLDKECRSFQLVRHDERGQKMFDAVFRNEPVTAPPADPLVPDYLRKIDRTIKKEPTYANKPKYVLIVLGPKAEFKVWVAIDGDTAYIDRNGNGDLTEEGESRKLLKRGKGIARQREVDLAFSLPGVKKTGIDVYWTQLEGFTGGYVALSSDGHRTQLGGWYSMDDWKYAPSPEQAAIIHLGSSVVTVRPSLRRPIADREWRPAVPDANKETRVYFEVGTPGVGTGNGGSSAGSFAWFLHSSFGYGMWPFRSPVLDDPIAEFEFTPINSTEGVKKVKVVLSDRVEQTLFGGKITVPEGVKTGLDAAKVTLSYPNCPWGKVEPVTYLVDVIPKR